MASDQGKVESKSKDVKAKSGFNLMEFAQETKREIAKVTWPSRRETIITTATVVIMALIASVFFLAVDSGLGFVIGRLLGMNS